MSAYSTRECAPGDEGAVRELFAQVFHKPMSEALWRWKYANPAGHGTLVWKGGELLAHYGGMGRDILYFGEPSRAVQITDVMVKTAGRASVRRGSPFYLAGKAFLERYIGYDQPYLLGFGFPSDRHMKLAEHLNLYASVGKMVETVWQLKDARQPLLYEIVALSASRHNGSSSSIEPLSTDEPLPTHGLRSSNQSSPSLMESSSPGLTGGPSESTQVPLAETSSSRGPTAGSRTPFDEYRTSIDQLWSRLAADLAHNIVAIKDAAFLRRRYLDHPEKTYDLRLVRHRLTRRPLGLVVLFHEADHSLLMDLVGPLANFPALIRCAASITAHAGRPQMKAWCSRAFAPAFRHGASEQNPLPITTPTNILTPAPPPEGLLDKWWLMPGDTDFL